jgi:SAM-dependent methyltransferase
MIRWGTNNLATDGFEFQHHDVYHPTFNPRQSAKNVPFPMEDRAASLVIAHSVFTHLPQAQCEHYLREVARILRPDGVMISTWFLFDKRSFPMMQDFQNTLYINDVDVTNATIFDRHWMVGLASSLGLTIRSVQAPGIRGFHWTLQFTPAQVPAAPWPEDSGPIGRAPPPLSRKEDLSGVGLEQETGANPAAPCIAD